jgi:hypothetical protein
MCPFVHQRHVHSNKVHNCEKPEVIPCLMSTEHQDIREEWRNCGVPVWKQIDCAHQEPARFINEVRTVAPKWETEASEPERSQDGIVSSGYSRLQKYENSSSHTLIICALSSTCVINQLEGLILKNNLLTSSFSDLIPSALSLHQFTPHTQGSLFFFRHMDLGIFVPASPLPGGLLMLSDWLPHSLPQIFLSLPPSPK